MPSAIDEIIKRRVVQQWFDGIPRDKIATDNDVGTGTVSGIINNYKTQVEGSDFDSVRALAVEIRKQGLTFADLATNARLYNYFRHSGVNEDEIESFINRVSSSDIPKEMAIDYVNQLYDISKEQSSPSKRPMMCYRLRMRILKQ